MKFYNRVGHVEIITEDGKVSREYNGLDFRFHVEKTYGGTKDTATVGILGLNQESISYLSTFADMATVLSKRRRVRVYAGYEDEGENLIIDGDMIEAIPSIPPDNWLTIRVVCNAYRNTEMMSMSMISEPKWNKRLQAQNQKWGFRIDEILDRFVKYAGLDGWRISDSDPDEHMRLYNLVYGMYLRSFDCTGTRDDIIRELNRIGDFAVALDGRTLVVGPRPWLLNRGYPTLQQQVEYNQLGSRGQKKHMKIPVLDMEHGLVGIPQYKWPCCTMTTFLTCGTKIFDRVELKCRYNTEANGIYVVYGISYDGQLRGTPWYAKLHARADGVPLTDQEKAQMEQKTKEK